MDLANIEVFLAIARTRSISKAAKTLFVSQSTVSYRLKLLEEELDCKLIERGRGQNQSLLTKEGETFFPIAERLKISSMILFPSRKSPAILSSASAVWKAWGFTSWTSCTMT